MAKAKGLNWTNEEVKAIYGYAAMKDLRMVLCNRPTVKYIAKSDGREISISIGEVMRDYSISVEEEKKENARVKANEKREAANKAAAAKYTRKD